MFLYPNKIIFLYYIFFFLLFSIREAQFITGLFDATNSRLMSAIYSLQEQLCEDPLLVTLHHLPPLLSCLITDVCNSPLPRTGGPSYEWLWSDDCRLLHNAWHLRVLEVLEPGHDSSNTGCGATFIVYHIESSRSLLVIIFPPQWVKTCIRSPTVSDDEAPIKELHMKASSVLVTNDAA